MSISNEKLYMKVCAVEEALKSFWLSHFDKNDVNRKVIIDYFERLDEWAETESKKLE